MTFWAVNKKLYDDAIEAGKSEKEALFLSKVMSMFVKTNFNHLITPNGLLKPDYELFYGFNRITEKVELDQEWKLVPAHDRTLQNGTKVRIRAHYRPAKHNANYTTYDPKNKDDVHRVAQDILLVEFLESDLKLYHHKVPIPLKAFDYIIKAPENLIAVSFLEVRKQTDQETEQGTFKDERIADFFLEFEEFNSEYGKGIVIEIYNTESKTSISKKQHDWNSCGYSYAAISIEDFNIKNEVIKKDRIIRLKSFKEYFTTDLVEEINKKKEIIECNVDIYIEKVSQLYNKQDEKIKQQEQRIEELQQTIEMLGNKEKTINKIQEEVEEKIKNNINNNIMDYQLPLLKRVRQIRGDFEKHIAISEALLEKFEYYEKNSSKLCQELEKSIFRSCSKTKTECLGWIKGKCDVYVTNKMHEIKNKRMD